MPIEDNSQAARIARRKQKILSEISKNSSAFTDYSIFQQQNLGNVRFTHQTPGGRVDDIPCTCVVPTPIVPYVPEIIIDIVLDNSGEYNTFIAKYSPTGNILWVAKIGGATNDKGYGTATDANDNILVTGPYTSAPLIFYNANGVPTMTLNTSELYDVFIAKYSPAGEVLWVARIGGTDYESGNGITTDSDNNIVVTGSYVSNPLIIYNSSEVAIQTLGNDGTYNTFIVKYSPAGEVLWAARVSGTGNVFGNGITADVNNNIILTGSYTSNPVTFYDANGVASQTLGNSGTYNTYIAKYGSDGLVVWVARIGGTAIDQGQKITTDTTNNILVSGNYNSNPVTFYDAAGVASQTLVNDGTYNVFIAKYSPLGEVIWAARISGAGNIFTYGISTDTSNNIVVSGYYNTNPLTIYNSSEVAIQTLGNAGAYNTFIAKYSFAGEVLWAARIGDTGDDGQTGITTDATNTIIVTGYFSSNPLNVYNASDILSKTLDNSGTYNGFIAKYSSDGDVVWATRVGGTGADDEVTGVATDSNSNIVVSGYFSSTQITIYYAR